MPSLKANVHCHGPPLGQVGLILKKGQWKKKKRKDSGGRHPPIPIPFPFLHLIVQVTNSKEVIKTSAKMAPIGKTVHSVRK